MEAVHLTIYPKDYIQLDAIKAFAKALKIKIEVNKEGYNKDFVGKILLSEAQIKQGKTKKINKEEFKTLLNL